MSTPVLKALPVVHGATIGHGQWAQRKKMDQSGGERWIDDNGH